MLELMAQLSLHRVAKLLYADLLVIKTSGSESRGQEEAARMRLHAKDILWSC